MADVLDLSALPPVGVPVLRRYDLLMQLAKSLAAGTVVPPALYIINNGQQSIPSLPLPYAVHTPTASLGLAESWNRLTLWTAGARVLVNDDVVFAPGSYEALVSRPEPFVSALAGSNAFSCFLLRDACVDLVGLFDETISPGYAYFEDNDYAERMAAAGVDITAVECGVRHLGSQTLAAYSAAELTEHHRRFEIAKANFVKKYGRLPHGGTA